MKGGEQSPRASSPHPDSISFELALRRYFVKRVGIADADDLVQEVMVRLQARKSQDPINDMASYVFAVASNVLKEAKRKSSAFLIAEHTDADTADWLTPERIVAGRLNMTRLMGTIERLPERTRRIFVAHRFEEMTYGAIATLFGISVSAVEKHIMAALCALTAAMREGDR